LPIILQPYRVEHHARDAGILGTVKHLRLRRAKSRPIRVALKAWMDETRRNTPPRSPLGEALAFTYVEDLTPERLV
jgi:hypothetical protein